jgi:hypothetical protein
METVIQPKVSCYQNKDACRRDDYIILPKQTALCDVIERCFREGCYGFARGSNVQGKGQFYIRSLHKTNNLLKTKLIDRDNITFFILEY